MEKAAILISVFAVGFCFGSLWMAEKCKNIFAKVLMDIEEEIQNEKRNEKI